MMKKELETLSWLEVTDQMLPLSCPLPNETMWNKHPRVYLPVKKAGEVVCPYCSNKFIYTCNKKNS